MGIHSLLNSSKRRIKMIKFTIVVCLAAVASAEADGHFGYAGLGHSVYAAPYRYSGAYGYAAPLTGAGITVRGYGTPATVGTHAPYGYAASGHYVLTLLELFMLPRERLRLNQRLRLMLFMATMDMVLDTLPTPDQSMEDTPPTPDQLSPAMLPHLSLPPLATLPTLEDTPATMARERLRLNQRLMLMLSMATTDMVLDTLPTPDQSMEDTQPTPDQLSPAMLPDQLFPPLDTLPSLDQSMEDTPATMAREMLKLNQKLTLNTLDTLVSMEDTPPMPDPLFLLSTLDLLSPLSTPDQSSPRLLQRNLWTLLNLQLTKK